MFVGLFLNKKRGRLKKEGERTIILYVILIHCMIRTPVPGSKKSLQEPLTST